MKIVIIGSLGRTRQLLNLLNCLLESPAGQESERKNNDDLVFPLPGDTENRDAVCVLMINCC